jgi:hypothetical protein
MRFVASLFVLAVAVGVASADGLVPPPKGKKYVSVTGEVLAGKGVKGYVFVQRTASGGGRPGTSPTLTFGKVVLDEKKAWAVPAAVGKFGSVSLLAVPEDAAKEYKTDEELFDALEKKAVKGVQQLAFTSRATVDEKVKGNKVTWTWTVTGVDEKGIQATVSGDGYEDPKKDKPLAFSEPGYLVGGIAAALAVTFGGLWLVRRRR